MAPEYDTEKLLKNEKITIYLRCYDPHVRHRKVLEIEDNITAQDLRSGLEYGQLEHTDRGFEELLHGIFTRVPIAYTIDQHAPAAWGSIGWHRYHIVIAYDFHLLRIQLLMDLRIFLFEVVVIHYLLKDFLRKMNHGGHVRASRVSH